MRDARQDRLQPVLHVLHVEEHGAELSEYVNELVDVGAAFYRPNFFANTPDILHALPAGRRAARPSRPGSCSRRRCRRPTASTPASSTSRTCPLREGSEEYLDSEKYEVKQRALDGPLLPLIGRLNAIRRENPALQHVDNLALPRDRERRADRLRQARRTTTWSSASSTSTRPAAREGVAVLPAWIGLPPAFPVRDLLSGERVRLAHRAQLRPPRPGAGARAAGRTMKPCPMSHVQGLTLAASGWDDVCGRSLCGLLSRWDGDLPETTSIRAMSGV